MSTSTSFLDTSTVPQSTTASSCTGSPEVVTFTLLVSDNATVTMWEEFTTPSSPDATGQIPTPCRSVVYTTVSGSPTPQPQTSTSFLDTSTVPRSTTAPTCTSGEAEVTYTVAVSEETVTTMIVQNGTTTLFPATTSLASPACGAVVYTTIHANPSITPGPQKLVNDGKNGAVMVYPSILVQVLVLVMGASVAFMA